MRKILLAFVSIIVSALPATSSTFDEQYDSLNKLVKERLSKAGVETTPQKVTALTLAQVVFYQDRFSYSIVHPNGRTNIQSMSDDNLKLLVRGLKVTTPEKAMRTIFKEYGVVVLRQPKPGKVKLMIGCGEFTEAYNTSLYHRKGTGLWKDVSCPELKDADEYRSHHKHPGWVTINPDIVANPNILTYYDSAKCDRYLCKEYKGMVTEVHTESIDQCLSEKAIALYKRLLVKGGKLSFSRLIDMHVLPEYGTKPQGIYFGENGDMHCIGKKAHSQIFDWIIQATIETKTTPLYFTGPEVIRFFQEDFKFGPFDFKDLAAMIKGETITPTFRPLVKAGFTFTELSPVMLERYKDTLDVTIATVFGFSLSSK